METVRKSGRGKKEVSLLGLFGKKLLEETQNKLAEATGISFFIIDYKGEPVTKGEKEERYKNYIPFNENVITKAYSCGTSCSTYLNFSLPVTKIYM